MIGEGHQASQPSVYSQAFSHICKEERQKSWQKRIVYELWRRWIMRNVAKCDTMWPGRWPHMFRYHTACIIRDGTWNLMMEAGCFFEMLATVYQTVQRKIKKKPTSQFLHPSEPCNMKMLKPAMILFRNCKCGIKIGYWAVQNLLSSRLLSRGLKIKIYRTKILPVVLYGCETWSLTLRE
jgi:hypothetical protein